MFMNIAKKMIAGFMLVGMACFVNATEIADKDMPPLEKSFIDIVSKAIDEATATTDEAKINNIGFDMAKSLSNLIKDRTATNWVGQVIFIKSDPSDGSARIGITLWSKDKKAIGVATFDNKTGDDKWGAHTGINVGTDLYKTVSNLEVGDKVIFSGRFFAPSPDALYAGVMKIGQIWSSMTTFQFTNIKKIN